MTDIKCFEPFMALNGLFCADVQLRTTHSEAQKLLMITVKFCWVLPKSLSYL